MFWNIIFIHWLFMLPGEVTLIIYLIYKRDVTFIFHYDLLNLQNTKANVHDAINTQDIITYISIEAKVLKRGTRIP